MFSFFRYVFDKLQNKSLDKDEKSAIIHRGLQFTPWKEGDLVKVKEIDMLSCPVTKGLFAMAFPIILMNVFQQLFNAIDMAVLGEYAGDTAVGAVGVCGVYIALFFGLVNGLATGTNIVISRCLGLRERERAERTIGTSMISGLFVGFLLLGIGVLLAHPLLLMVDCDAQLLGEATRYFRLYFCGLPACVLYLSSNSVLRARGETRLPMIYLIIGAAAKVVLNFVFVAGLGMKVDGVAYATILSNVITAVLTFRAVYKMEGSMRFYWKNMRIFRQELGQILATGIPVGVEQMLYSCANLAILAVVNGYGPDTTTGYTISLQFNNIIYNVCVCTSFAVMPFVAQNAGAGNFARVREITRKSVLLTTALGGGCGWLFAIFSRPLASLMSKSPAVIETASKQIVLISGLYFICGIAYALNAVLRGLGRPIIPTVSSMLFMFALRFLWVWFIYPLCPNIVFLYTVWPVSWVLCSITGFAFCLPTLRRLEKKPS